MDRIAQIRDPGGKKSHKAKASGHRRHVLPPVSGVGWVDPEVEALKAGRAEAETPDHLDDEIALPSPMSGVSRLQGWEAMVHWGEVLARYPAPGAAAAQPRAPLTPSAATSGMPQAKDKAAASQTGSPRSGDGHVAEPSATPPVAPDSSSGARWKPSPQVSTGSGSAWKPDPSPASASAETGDETATNAWKPSPISGAGGWKPKSKQAAAWKPRAAETSADDTSSTPSERSTQTLPPDTLKKVAVLMRRRQLKKSASILKLWLEANPNDATAQRMLDLCLRPSPLRKQPRPAGRTHLPAPNPSAIPVVNMEALMTATNFTPTDAYILSRIDGTTPISNLALIVPELSGDGLTALLVRSWKAGVLHFKA